MIDDDVRGKGGDGRYHTKNMLFIICVCATCTSEICCNAVPVKSFIYDVNIPCMHTFHFCFIGTPQSKHEQINNHRIQSNSSTEVVCRYYGNLQSISEVNGIFCLAVGTITSFSNKMILIRMRFCWNKNFVTF